MKAAHIIVVGTPIWLGEESSVCRMLIERLYAMSGTLNDTGQSTFYGKVGGTVITGNEDGIKHCAMTILYALQHLGYVIPPQADCGWIGEAGPGPSYGDDVDGARGIQQRIHPTKYDDHDLESAASGAHADRRWRYIAPRQRPRVVESWLSV